jgi:DNA-directed RNA polymerase subunit RPC12/RpoP
MSQINTDKELLDKLELLGIEDEQKKKEITCSLIGHSRIQTFCFGYYNCARCGAQLGDSLGGIYPGAEKAVVVGHKCPTCEANYKELTWKDKIFCPDPFSN